MNKTETIHEEMENITAEKKRTIADNAERKLNSIATTLSEKLTFNYRLKDSDNIVLNGEKVKSNNVRITTDSKTAKEIVKANTGIDFDEIIATIESKETKKHSIAEIQKAVLMKAQTANMLRRTYRNTITVFKGGK